MTQIYSLFSSPIFGVLMCVLTYSIAVKIRKATGSVIANPFVISCLMIVGILLVLDVPYSDFNIGGGYISFFLSPVTVLLAVPLYKHRNLLNEYFLPIFLGIFSGVAATLVSVVLLSRTFGFAEVLEKSMLAKSITTPIGIEVTRSIQGVEGITVLAIILSGIFGAVIAPTLFSWCGISSPVAQGIGLGSASHAIGTSKAMEMGEKQGALSGLTIGIAGITTVVVVSLIEGFFY